MPYPQAIAFRGGGNPGGVWRAAVRRMLSVFSTSLRMAPPMHGKGRLLEIGCSSGEELYCLRQYGWDARGVEPSAAACIEAWSLALDVQACSLEEADLPAASFDVIELSHVLEHLGDPVACLAKLRDALAPGGKIILCLPNGRSLGARLFGRTWRGLEVPRHYAVYSPDSMRRLALRVGLRVSRVSTLAAPEVIVGSVKFTLAQRRRERLPTAIGVRSQPERRIKNLAGRLLRAGLSALLVPAALAGRGEVMRVELMKSTD